MGCSRPRSSSGPTSTSRLISRTTHHLFQPLLYQVATGVLSTGEIAPSTREVLRRQRNVTTLLGDVTDIDLDQQVGDLAGARSGDQDVVRQR